MSDQFMRRRSRPIMLALAENLGRLAVSRALHVGSFSGSATVVGGGPSVSRFVPDGSFVFAVNTAAPRVPGADAVVVREVVDTASQLASARSIVLDVQTSPATVARAIDVAPVLWCIPAQNHLAWLFTLLGVRPVYGGESAMTLSVGLCAGADSVTLIGCDLCFAPDGAAYGAGTAWDGVRVDASRGFVDFGDRGGMEESARRSGVPAPPRRESASTVIREDGTEALALATWVSQKGWLEQWANRHKGGVHVNLSGGAKIEGWEREPEPGAPGRLSCVELDTSRVDAEVRRQLAVARATLDHAAPWTLGLAGFPLVEFTMQAEILETSDRRLPLGLALAERPGIFRRAIEDVERAYERGLVVGSSRAA